MYAAAGGLEFERERCKLFVLGLDDLRLLVSLVRRRLIRKNAISAGLILDGIDAGDEYDITEGADQMVETHDLILDACG